MTVISFLLPCALMAQIAPPASEIIQKAIAAGKLEHEKNWKYTFREDHEQVQIDKNGKPTPTETKTYEHIMLEGEEYKKLVLINGRPLDAKTQKKVDEDLDKTRTERRKRGPFHVTRTVELGDLEQLERIFDNTVTGEETVLGRKTWRVESEPKAGYKAADKREQELIAARHTSWFDQADGTRIKWLDLFVRATNGFGAGTIFDWELTRVGDAWLLDNVGIKADMTIVLGIHARLQSRQRMYDYKRFTVDSTLTPQ